MNSKIGVIKIWIEIELLIYYSKYMKLILSLLFFLLLISNLKATPFPHHGHSSEQTHLQHSEEHCRASLLSWQSTIQLYISPTLLKVWLVSQLTLDRSNVSHWKLGNLSKTFTSLFSIYHALIASKVPDPRISILSSRAHPPTF